MSLDKEILNHLRRIKSEIEELLEEVGDIVPPDFRTTCILRYCGNNSEVKDMIFTDDVTYDAAAALNKYQEEVDSQT